MTGRPHGNLRLPSARRIAWHLVTLGSLVLATVLNLTWLYWILAAAAATVAIKLWLNR